MIANSLDLAGRVDSVVAGKDGRLFLSRGEGFDAQSLFGRPFTDDEGLERSWRVCLERRKRLCEEVGAVFVVLVAPEAHGVHADQLPEPLAYHAPSIADRFVALARSLGITCVWPKAEIAAAKGPVEVYRRDDSHWTTHGAYIAYRELMAALPETLRAGKIEADGFSYLWSLSMGDLAWTGPDAKRRPMLRPHFEQTRARVVLDRHNERRHALKVTEVDDPTLPTALIFRDSAATEMGPFLCESFRRTTLVGSAERTYLELVAEERPQIVILERSERSLLNGSIDWGMETWRGAFPAADGDNEALDAEIAARGLAAEGLFTQALERAQAALEREPTVSRRILVGRILFALGQAAEAAVVLERAVEEEPGRWAALIQLGCARLGLGDMAGGRDLFARACAVAPWHPLGFEHFGYASLHMGDAAGAATALREAVRLGPEYGGGHVWLHEALLRLDRTDEAEAVLTAALARLPDDPALVARGAALKKAA